MEKHSLPSAFPHVLYTPPGANSNALGDITVIADGNEIHLFHLTLPGHHVIAHAVSKDGFSWKAASNALTVGSAGTFDDDMLWTMHVIKHPEEKLFLMYYTGCSTKENGQVQRIGLATSRDLHHWERSSDLPILEAAAPYLSDKCRVGFVSFRDPYVFIDSQGLWHMLVTARTARGERFQSGCVAHAVSKNGVNWELKKPLFEPRQYEDLEVPSLLQGPKSLALYFHEFSVGQTHLRVAKDLKSQWRRPGTAEPLPNGQAVFRFCEWKGRTLLYHWTRFESDWGRRGCYSGQRLFALSMPKEMHWKSDGAPVIRSYDGWSRYGKVKPLSRNMLPSMREGWKFLPKASMYCKTVARSSIILRKKASDFIVSGMVKTRNAARVEFIFRSDTNAEKRYGIELDFQNQRIELHRYSFRDVSVKRYKQVRPTLIQGAYFALPKLFRGQFRLIACGEYIEFSLQERVILSSASYLHKEGLLGFCVTEGIATFSNLSFASLKFPYDC